MSAPSTRHRVVVIGGGFAGVAACQKLAALDVDVVLVDQRNFHLFQPLLYQVATGGLSPGDIAAPLRTVLKDAANVSVLLARAEDIDVAARTVTVKSTDDDAVSTALPYDTLIVAAGARHAYFGNPAWELVAPGLKTIEDATDIRARVFRAFEAAERAAAAGAPPADVQELLTFVVVGAGPTGVELAGALAELAQHTMRGEFRHIRSEHAKVLLVEGGPRILPMYAPRLSDAAVAALQRLNVAVLVNTKVTAIDAHGVSVGTARGLEVYPSRTVLWAAGVQASPLGAALARATGCAVDRAGRVVVARDCSLPGHGEILVLGDLASFTHTKDGAPVPGIAPAAMQMGKHAADVVEARLAGRAPPAFRYFDKGMMAVIGRNEAVARLGVVNWGLSGFLAWVAWLAIHLLFLVGFENKVLVLVQWANHYLTRNRGARLIASAGPPQATPAARPDSTSRAA